MDWSNATSGWIPQLIAIIVMILIAYFSRDKIKEKWDSFVSKKNSSRQTANENGMTINTGSIGTVNNIFPSKSINPVPNQGNVINNVVRALVDDNVSLLSFNQIVYGKENDILDNLDYVVQQYLQKRTSYNGLLGNLAKCNNLNEKLKSMIKMISAKNGKKFDEKFTRLYLSLNWKDFLDEKFVEFVSPCYGNSWNDEGVLSKIIENILSELRSTGDYNVENDCSRVLQIFWPSLNEELRYEIAIAYRPIYKDSFRRPDFLQKQFAAKIYGELGYENIKRKMIYPVLRNAKSADVEKVAEDYGLNEEWVKKQYDELHAKRNLDLDDFARI